MVNSIDTYGPHKSFEDIKKIDENGVEFWSARDLFSLLGYSTWQAFDEVIDRAAKAALNSGQMITNHFSQLTKLVEVGSGGLYGSSLAEVEVKKGIEKGELLDRAGSSELAANLFRITQTDDKLKKDGARGDSAAQRTHNMIGGKVRQTIKDIGGTLPEDLKPEQHIRELKKAKKLMLK